MCRPEGLALVSDGKLATLGWGQEALVLTESCFLLSISDQRIESVAINSSGDWIALGCSGSSSCPMV